jgi:hypothetical protein
MLAFMPTFKATYYEFSLLSPHINKVKTLIYKISLEGSYWSVYLGNITWYLEGTLNITMTREGPRMILRINYVYPNLPDIYVHLKPQLEDLLRDIKMAILSNFYEKVSGKVPPVIYYSVNNETMMICKVYYITELKKNNELIIIYLSRDLSPLIIEVIGPIKGKALLATAQGVNCDRPLLTQSEKKLMSFLTLSITIAAIASLLLKPRVKTTWPMSS